MPLKTLLAVFGAVAGMLLAQPALGSTVRVVDDKVVYEAATGETNDITVVEAPQDVFTITDLNATIVSQVIECAPISPHAIRCSLQSKLPHEEVLIYTKDGADSVDLDSQGAFVDGGPGPDSLRAIRFAVLWGGLGADQLIGGRDTQFLSGGAGADSLKGGADDDLLIAGFGPDVIAGGSGYDMVSYEDHRDRNTPVRISLDGRANDGAVGEGDWIRADVEGAFGSLGPNTIAGNAGPNVLYGDFRPDVIWAGAGDDRVFGLNRRDLLFGGPGDDVLNGHGGADVLRGGRGNDILRGHWGPDNIRGGSGNDRLLGGSEMDILRAGPGRDRLLGASGADVLYARDGTRDVVRGGPGRDLARIDSIDDLLRVEVLF